MLDFKRANIRFCLCQKTVTIKRNGKKPLTGYLVSGVHTVVINKSGYPWIARDLFISFHSILSLTHKYRLFFLSIFNVGFIKCTEITADLYYMEIKKNKRIFASFKQSLINNIRRSKFKKMFTCLQIYKFIFSKWLKLWFTGKK